ncbi:hypothetical protein LEP1GSC058_1397 [Leptospira fainei serovar Hurstbridge str. BUT 6]|uniref:Uncharacterized protein n=1 Tax=Leptospira fainei serovar Hurstbridge str. BUT 6 TaxID=1193011 RepID=S3V0X9_9LEPT|nr:hypothetical protein [Leptospira fainei]EPG76346.1 hypothetical protein LEP1GSC058_1397 [Leptospira fainei serovar Hurstbridge str. BUT 6]
MDRALLLSGLRICQTEEYYFLSQITVKNKISIVTLLTDPAYFSSLRETIIRSEMAVLTILMKRNNLYKLRPKGI